VGAAGTLDDTKVRPLGGFVAVPSLLVETENVLLG
jgi:hypothetical protein